MTNKQGRVVPDESGEKIGTQHSELVGKKAAHQAMVAEVWSAPAAAKVAAHGRFLSETAAPKEIAFFKGVDAHPRGSESGAKADEQLRSRILAVKHVINEQGLPVNDVVGKAAKESRVLAIGEAHVDQTNPQRMWAASQMKNFRAQGITHLAVEFPSAAQPIFDQFNSSAKGSEFPVPDQLGKHDDTDTVMMLKGLGRLQVGRPDLMEMWKAAHDAGIKLVAVDNMANYMDSYSEQTKVVRKRRDEDMKNSVLKVLNQDQHNKVLVWLGDYHMANSHGSVQPKMFAERLDDELHKRGKGEKITTFFGGTSQRTDPDTSTRIFAASLKAPLSITPGKGAAVNELGRLPVLIDEIGESAPTFRLQHFDHVLLFPAKKGA